MLKTSIYIEIFLRHTMGREVTRNMCVGLEAVQFVNS